MHTHIGFIGQGWIGKHYADDFENRAYSVVRYALEEPYVQNKEEIKNCRIVFIAVPTPTTATGFSYEPVKNALSIVSPGTTVIIKSTILPGVTVSLQEEFPELFIMHSPEFLREASAAHDAANPDRNIIGIPADTDEFQKRAKEVLAILPHAEYQVVVSALEAEMVKYVGNCFLYSKVLMMNTFHDMVAAAGGDWEIVRVAMTKDPRIGESHTEPLHISGHDTKDGIPKRGAGGHCFIKDFEAFRGFHEQNVNDPYANKVIDSMIEYNNKLLVSTNKDIDLLTGVYGPERVEKYK
jgi:nucleotide sugar dehydrogenase